MARTRFEVRLEPEPKPLSTGMDRVEFMISPNPGEPLRPLANIASGGEISRVMLALKAISMDGNGVDSMVFDEIDTGVSGRMAQVVGEKMCLIAKTKQVLCITHLPQIASMADVHLYIAKHAQEGHTVTEVIRLTEAQEVNEIARMASGSDVSAASLDNAREMLSHARSRKQHLR